MSDFLLLDLPLEVHTPVAWLVWRRDDNSVVAQGSLMPENLVDLVDQFGALPCYAIVGGQSVSHHRIVLPKGGRVGLSALPFQLEERLCSDLDKVHYGHGDIRPNQPVSVLVIDRELMARYHQILLASGLKVRALLPDYAVLPENVVVLDNQRVSANLNELAAGLDAENFPVWWQLAVGQSPQIDAQFYTAADFTALASLPAEPIEHFNQRLEILARHFSPWSLNLLSGSYTIKDERQPHLSQWRWPVGLAVALLLLHWLSLGVAIFDNNRRIERLDTAMDTLYLETFPGSRVVNARSQMRSQLNALAGSGVSRDKMLPWLQAVAKASVGSAALQLSQLSYESDPAVMKLMVRAENFEVVDQWVAALGGQGLTVSRGGFSQEGGVISGQLSIQEAAQ